MCDWKGCEMTWGMRFGQAIGSVMRKIKIRREVWPATIYVALHDVDGEGRLMILSEADGQLHPWTISASDLSADDWVMNPPVSAVDVAKPTATPSLEPPATPSLEPPDDGLDGTDWREN